MLLKTIIRSLRMITTSLCSRFGVYVMRAGRKMCYQFSQRTAAIAIVKSMKTSLRNDGRGPQAAAVSFMFGAGASVR